MRDSVILRVSPRTISVASATLPRSTAKPGTAMLSAGSRPPASSSTWSRIGTCFVFCSWRCGAPAASRGSSWSVVQPSHRVGCAGGFRGADHDNAFRYSSANGFCGGPTSPPAGTSAETRCLEQCWRAPGALLRGLASAGGRRRAGDCRPPRADEANRGSSSRAASRCAGGTPRPEPAKRRQRALFDEPWDSYAITWGCSTVDRVVVGEHQER